MAIQYVYQQYQEDAVCAVVDVFAGQNKSEGNNYLIAPGRTSQDYLDDLYGLRNNEIALSQDLILKNIIQIQERNGIDSKEEKGLHTTAAADINLDIEMETGTGKTFVYTQTMFELNKKYGWSKFIIVVPTIAIREGVKQSLDSTAQYFHRKYGKRIHSFIYDSHQLHELESYSSSSGIQVMIINVQAFNSTSKDNLRIYNSLDAFQSRKPIDVIRTNRPILIIDEPQKLGEKSLSSLAKFDPLFVLRYSATHRIRHNLVYRLDAIDAFNNKLVKKIAVRAVIAEGFTGRSPYIYVSSIDTSPNGLEAKVEIEIQQRDSIERKTVTISKGSDFYKLSKGIESYKGLKVTDIVLQADRQYIELTNDQRIVPGQLTLDSNLDDIRRLQIREVIKAHLDKEEELYSRGVKVLSLFFIDQVSKYRDYDLEDTRGEYARIFEEEYKTEVDKRCADLTDNPVATQYVVYLKGIDLAQTHKGYFSVDKGHYIDSKMGTGDNKGISVDVDAYNLILKDKERLMSLSDPTRFIFSHSALREGWDNPNVFVIGVLKNSVSITSRRQEIGRGLRLSVDSNGMRMDSPRLAEDEIHTVNKLTIVTDEGYKEFVEGLQTELFSDLKSRPRKARIKEFIGRMLTLENGDEHLVDEQTAEDIQDFFTKNGLIDETENVTKKYRSYEENDKLPLPKGKLKQFGKAIYQVIDAQKLQITVENDRDNEQVKLNVENYNSVAFQRVWKFIKHKATFHVDFDSDSLIQKCISEIDDSYDFSPMRYTIESGEQKTDLLLDDLSKGSSFSTVMNEVSRPSSNVVSSYPYDLVGEIAEKTSLTRKTISTILIRIDRKKFAHFQENPEDFIQKIAFSINKIKRSLLTNAQGLKYTLLPDEFQPTIFNPFNTRRRNQGEGDYPKHVFTQLVADSKVEKDFAKALEAQKEVEVYAKLPPKYEIPTPMGRYNPDWAIAYESQGKPHIVFVAETKGSLDDEDRRGIENGKIDSARKFFKELKSLQNSDESKVIYEVVTTIRDMQNAIDEET